MEHHNELGSEKRRNFLKQITGGITGLAAGLGLSGISGCQSELEDQPAQNGEVIIDRIESFKVVVPLSGPVSSQDLLDGGEYFWKGPKFIIKLYGDNGHVGLAESGRNRNEDELEKNKQYLIGKNILSLNLAHPTLGLPYSSSSAAFEMAIFDLIGKSLGIPVYKLLGGKHQEKVAVTYWTRRWEGEGLARVAKRAVDMGYTGFKWKQKPWDSMVGQVETIYKAAPSLRLVLDSNRTYKNFYEFVNKAKEAEKVGNIACFEDPMPHDVDTYVRLREQLNTPLAMHTSDLSLITKAIKAEACQIFNLGGDMRTFVRLSHLIDAWGLKCWHGSGGEIGVQDASYVHAVAATPNGIIPSDIQGHFIREDDLLIKSYKVENGFAIVPDDPGLGVELDEDAVKKYSV